MRQIQLQYKNLVALEEAARVYDAAAIKEFGEFAWTNFCKLR